MPAWVSYLQNEDTGVWEITGIAFTGGYQGTLGCDLPMGSMQNTWRLNWYLSEFPKQPTKQESGTCACSRSAKDLKFKTRGLEGCSGNADLMILA